jgi:hypothetical protein
MRRWGLVGESVSRGGHMLFFSFLALLGVDLEASYLLSGHSIL